MFVHDTHTYITKVIDRQTEYLFLLTSGQINRRYRAGESLTVNSVD